MKNIKVLFLSFIMIGASSLMQASQSFHERVVPRHEQSCCARFCSSFLRLKDDSNRILWDFVGWSRTVLTGTAIALVTPYISKAPTQVQVAYGCSCVVFTVGAWNNTRLSLLRYRARAQAVREGYVELGDGKAVLGD